MKDAEEKILKAQVVLYQEIQEADHMILYEFMFAVKKLHEIINSKTYPSEGETVEFTAEEFNKLRYGLQHLSSETECSAEFHSWAESQYIQPKKDKLKILQMLR